MKPTEQALNAASAILSGEWAPNMRSVATLIDEQTGLPALLAALEAQP